MLATLGLLVASQLNLAPPSVCTAAETRVAMAVTRTLTLADFTLGLDETAPPARRSSGLELRRPSFLRSPPPNARVGFRFPSLSLGILAELRVELGLSIGSLVGSSCALALLTAPEITPMHASLTMPVTTRLDLAPRVDLSLLAPWYGLISRLGEDVNVSTRISVSTGVAMGTTVPLRSGGSAQGTQQSAPGWTGPRLSSPGVQPMPVVRSPSVSVAPTTRGAVRR